MRTAGARCGPGGQSCQLPPGGERNGARILRQGIDKNVKTVTGFSSFQGIHLELDAQILQSQQDTDKSKAKGLAYQVHL